MFHKKVELNHDLNITEKKFHEMGATFHLGYDEQDYDSQNCYLI